MGNAETETEAVSLRPEPKAPAPAEALAEAEYQEMFRQYFPEALRQTRRLMLNSSDEALVLKAAESIFDRGGATRKAERATRPVIHISDSHVQLLIQATKEGL
jgi:hypothetical protein